MLLRHSRFSCLLILLIALIEGTNDTYYRTFDQTVCVLCVCVCVYVKREEGGCFSVMMQPFSMVDM